MRCVDIEYKMEKTFIIRVSVHASYDPCPRCCDPNMDQGQAYPIPMHIQAHLNGSEVWAVKPYG